MTKTSNGSTVTLAVTYTYDANDKLVSEAKWKTGVGVVTTRRHWDGEDLWAITDASNVVATRFLYADGVDAAQGRIVETGTNAGTQAFYATDNLGSVRDIVRASTGAIAYHADYDAFGTATEYGAGFGDTLKYTAREYDADTGLQYNRARWYDAKVGRWLSEDPIGFDAGDHNLYRYVANGATNATDPSGLFKGPGGGPRPGTGVSTGIIPTNVLVPVAVAEGVAGLQAYNRFVLMNKLATLDKEINEAARKAFERGATQNEVEAITRASRIHIGPFDIRHQILGELNYLRSSAWQQANPAASLLTHFAKLSPEERRGFFPNELTRRRATGACLVAGSPLLTPDGSKPIEQLQPGDLVLTRHETGLNYPIRPQRVLEVFHSTAFVVCVHVAGRVIRTTVEHPFWVAGIGWIAAGALRSGYFLSSHDGKWMPVEAVTLTGEQMPVYNIRVAEDHTYFVGCEEWGFSVWSHNVCFERYGSAREVELFFTFVQNFTFAADLPNNGLRFGLRGTIDRRKLTKPALVDEKYGYKFEFELEDHVVRFLREIMGVNEAEGHPGSLEIKPKSKSRADHILADDQLAVLNMAKYNVKVFNVLTGKQVQEGKK